jgi:hypothetical protein
MRAKSACLAPISCRCHQRVQDVPRFHHHIYEKQGHSSLKEASLFYLFIWPFWNATGCWSNKEYLDHLDTHQTFDFCVWRIRVRRDYFVGWIIDPETTAADSRWQWLSNRTELTFLYSDLLGWTNSRLESVFQAADTYPSWNHDGSITTPRRDGLKLHWPEKGVVIVDGIETAETFFSKSVL